MHNNDLVKYQDWSTNSIRWLCLCAGVFITQKLGSVSRLQYRLREVATTIITEGANKLFFLTQAPKNKKSEFFKNIFMT